MKKVRVVQEGGKIDLVAYSHTVEGFLEADYPSLALLAGFAWLSIVTSPSNEEMLTLRCVYSASGAKPIHHSTIIVSQSIADMVFGGVAVEDILLGWEQSTPDYRLNAIIDMIKAFNKCVYEVNTKKILI